jgi:hypothetical protein
MKKYTVAFLFLILLLSPMRLFAQSPAPGSAPSSTTNVNMATASSAPANEKVNNLYWNLGLGWAGFSGEVAPSVTGRPTFEAGVSAEFPINDRFYLAPGIELTEKGAMNDGSAFRIGYLQFPLLAKYCLIQGPVKVDLEGGAYYAVAFERTASVAYYSLDISNIIKPNDSGYIVGVCTTWNKTFNFEVNYSSSFSSVWEGGANIKNSVVTIRGGTTYKF